MSDDAFQQKFDQALRGLREGANGPEEDELKGLEHHVWSEIALREGKRERAMVWGGLLTGRAPLAAAAMATISVSAGIVLGLTQASAYGRETAREFEQRYVESIHPVMMSNSAHPHPHFEGEAPHEHPPTE